MNIYGLKGIAAYAEHAHVLDLTILKSIRSYKKRLPQLVDESLSADDLVALTMETGKNGVEVMALLDKANTSTNGNPEITKVNIGVRNNPGILISGHDLKDLDSF
jgi:hydroxylamine reductase